MMIYFANKLRRGLLCGAVFCAASGFAVEVSNEVPRISVAVESRGDAVALACQRLNSDSSDEVVLSVVLDLMTRDPVAISPVVASRCDSGDVMGAKKVVAAVAFIAPRIHDGKRLGLDVARVITGSGIDEAVKAELIQASSNPAAMLSTEAVVKVLSAAEEVVPSGTLSDKWLPLQKLGGQR